MVKGHTQTCKCPICTRMRTGNTKHPETCTCACCLNSRGIKKIGKDNHFYGKHHSEETKEDLKVKCSKTSTEIWKNRTPEERGEVGNKISKGRIGIPQSEEAKLGLKAYRDQCRITGKWSGGRKKLPRETRTCACGCGETFICKVTSKQKFLNHSHHMKHTRKIKEYKHTSWNKGLTKETDPRVLSMSVNKKSLGLGSKTNSKESILKLILDTNFNGSYKLVSAGTWLVGGKGPDFVDYDRKEVIEHFGLYWHYLRPYSKDKSFNPVNHELDRIAHFKKYGYKCLVIWENELKDIISIVDKVKRFRQGKTTSILSEKFVGITNRKILDRILETT